MYICMGTWLPSSGIKGKEVRALRENLFVDLTHLHLGAPVVLHRVKKGNVNE